MWLKQHQLQLTTCGWNKINVSCFELNHNQRLISVSEDTHNSSIKRCFTKRLQSRPLKYFSICNVMFTIFQWVMFLWKHLKTYSYFTETGMEWRQEILTEPLSFSWNNICENKWKILQFSSFIFHTTNYTIRVIMYKVSTKLLGFGVVSLTKNENHKVSKQNTNKSWTL